MVKIVPPKAKPIPRDYQIFHTIHAQMRGASTRAIPKDMVEDTIRTGRALSTEEIGRHGGDIFEFSKIHYITEGKARTQKRVVAICEISGDDCRVITVFNES